MAARAGVKSTATSWLAAPFLQQREERRATARIRAITAPVPQVSPPPPRRTEEGDRLERNEPASNEEKQSLKPAVRPIGRGNRPPSHAFTPHCEKRLLPVLLAFSLAFETGHAISRPASTSLRFVAELSTLPFAASACFDRLTLFTMLLSALLSSV